MKQELHFSDTVAISNSIIIWKTLVPIYLTSDYNVEQDLSLSVQTKTKTKRKWSNAHTHCNSGIKSQDWGCSYPAIPPGPRQKLGTYKIQFGEENQKFFKKKEIQAGLLQSQ